MMQYNASRELEDHLLLLVNESLDSFLYDNAVFLAEILTSLVPSNEAYQYLLAVCYHRTNQVFRAYHTLKYSPCCNSPDSRLLLAQCCLEIGRAQEAERALADERGGVIGGAHGLYLLARVQRSNGKVDAARRLLAQSLGLDPTFWAALRDLCQLGAEEEAGRHLRRLESLESGPASDLASLIHDAGLPLPPASAHAPAAPLPPAAPALDYVPRSLNLQTPAPSTSEPMSLGRALPTAPTAQGGPSQAVPFPGFQTPTPTPTPGVQPQQMLFAGETPTQTPLHPGQQGPGRGGGPPPLARGAGNAAASSTPLATPSPENGAANPSFAAVNNLPTFSLGANLTPANAGIQLSGPPPMLYKGGKEGGHAGLPEGYFPIPPSASQVSPKFTAGLAPPRRKYVIEGKMRKVSGRLFGVGDEVPSTTPVAASIPPPPLFSAVPLAPNAPAPAALQNHQLPAPAPAGPTADRSDREPLPHQPPFSQGPASSSTAGKPQEDLGPAIKGLREVCSLLRHLGQAYLLQCLFRAREAAEQYRRLPLGLSTRLAWVQTQLGRCHSELVDYAEAVRCFEAARRLCPHRLDGVEYHSTALWQLRRDVDLSHLAQDCLATDRLAPQAWLALGNCFSLAREHEMAARMMQRALQLDPSSAYAHTLCGHEYAALDDAERATNCFRQAIRCDPRHYQAWFGLGQAYLRQEKFDSAEAQFHRALELNPSSSVLLCYRGMVVARQGRVAEARRDLDRAIQCDPKNPLARFERASLLLGQGLLGEALEECQALRSIAPREPSVCFLMGKVLKRMGRRDEALRTFLEALDLKPPSSDLTAIKAAMERLHLDDETEGDWE